MRRLKSLCSAIAALAISTAGAQQNSDSPQPCGGRPAQSIRIQEIPTLLCRLTVPARSTLPVRVSPQCQALDAGPPCGALAFINPNRNQREATLKAFQNPANKSIDRSGGKNPAALFCTYIQGKPRIAESRDGSQDTVCQATDGTLILAWDLYEAFQH